LPWDENHPDWEEGPELTLYDFLDGQANMHALKQIEDAFGPDVKKEPKGGAHAINVSAELLYLHLNKPWIPSDK